MKKILVTGGAGFIGSNFINYIKQKYPKCYIVSLDKLTCNSDSENYKTIKGDISDRKFIFDLFEKEMFDVVINCANESDIEKYADLQSIFTITNIIGTQILLDASVECNVRRYHQVSTSEAYGELCNKKIPSYLASRLAGDLLVKVYNNEYDLRATLSKNKVDENNIEEYCQCIEKEINKKYILNNSIL